MPKVVVGSMRQKRLIEGEENLLESNEMLIQESDDFEFILKERTETGDIKTYAVLPVDKYIESLEIAFEEGLKSGKGNEART